MNWHTLDTEIHAHTAIGIHGQMIYVDPAAEMVIALIGGQDVTLKKFYRENGRIRLQPANQALQPILVDPDQVQVQGVVVGVMRRY